MLAQIRELIKSAKEALKGKWGTAIGIVFSEAGIMYAATMVVCFIAYIVIIIVAIFTGIMFANQFTGEQPNYVLISILIGVGILIIYSLIFIIYAFLSPLFIGKNKWFFNTVKGEQPAYNTLFSFMKKGAGYIRGIKLFLWRLLFTMLFSLIFLIPYLLLIGLFMFFQGSFNMMELNLTYIITFCSLGLIVFICYIFFIVFVQRYSLANYIFFESPKLKAKQCIDKSVSLMKGKCLTPVLISLFIFWPIIIPFIITIVLFIIGEFFPIVMIFAILLYFLSFLGLLCSMFYFYPLYEATMAKFAQNVFCENAEVEPEVLDM